MAFLTGSGGFSNKRYGNDPAAFFNLTTYPISFTGNEMDHFAQEASTRVLRLTASSKIAFAYAICVRLQPHYQAFFKAEGWGDPAALRSALTILRQAVFSAPAIADLHQQYRQVEAVTPDADDFGSVLGSFALDTCCALLSALDFILQGTDQYVLDVAILARNTVDMYVQELDNLEPDDPQLEQKIDCSPYMLQEVSWQREALARLEGVERPSEGLLDELLKGQMLDLELLPN